MVKLGKYHFSYTRIHRSMVEAYTSMWMAWNKKYFRPHTKKAHIFPIDAFSSFSFILKRKSIKIRMLWSIVISTCTYMYYTHICKNSQKKSLCKKQVKSSTKQIKLESNQSVIRNFSFPFSGFSYYKVVCIKCHKIFMHINDVSFAVLRKSICVNTRVNVSWELTQRLLSKNTKWQLHRLQFTDIKFNISGQCVGTVFFFWKWLNDVIHCAFISIWCLYSQRMQIWKGNIVI